MTLHLALFCQTPKNGGQTLILSLGVVGCNEGISSEFRKVTEEGQSPLNIVEQASSLSPSI